MKGDQRRRRGSTFTETAGKLACKAARLGHTMPACAARAGIDQATLWRWRKADEAFGIAFALAMTEGRASLEGHAIAGAPEDPKHALELLSRRYPKAWGRADRLKLDAKVTDATPDVFQTTAEAIACLDRMRAALEPESDE